MNSLVLALTKIGDLLLENTISENSDGQSIDGITLRIPEYQRPYKWTAKNVNQLLDDIMFAYNNNKGVYRVGTLILHKTTTEKGQTVYDIVDGQQRTITFSLMLAAFGEDNIDFLSQELGANPYSKFNVSNNFRALSRRVDSLKPEDKSADNPNSFRNYIKNNCELIVVSDKKSIEDFKDIFGDGSEKSRGVPLFIFNYCDYKLWKMYSETLRSGKHKEGSKVRNEFFAMLGCSDFGLKVFEQFYFSRTRRSLEHYFPQANVDKNITEDEINCFGNYAMIGSEANSSGSNWSPKVKLDHYLDSSGKIRQISVASLKFMVMMQMCKDKSQWGFDEIKEHQDYILDILFSQD